MTEDQGHGLNISGLAHATANDQLATPALSPTTERGLDGENYHFDSLLGANDVLDTAPVLRGNGHTVAHSVSVSAARDDVTQQSNGELTSPTPTQQASSRVLKLSPAKIHQLTSSPGSLPLRAISPALEDIPLLADGYMLSADGALSDGISPSTTPVTRNALSPRETHPEVVPALSSIRETPGALSNARPGSSSRSVSSPMLRRLQSTPGPRDPNAHRDHSRSRRPTLAAIKIGNPQQDHGTENLPTPSTREPMASPMPSAIPLPPLSLPTYLQLELSSERPSALYIHRPVSSDFPYESSKVKFERLLNFLLLPHQLEQVLWFGALACLDAWLYTFTILPLRFLKALALLVQWWIQNAGKEAKKLGLFVYGGLGRLWKRQRQSLESASRRSSASEVEPRAKASAGTTPQVVPAESGDMASDTPRQSKQRKGSTAHGNRRLRSRPSGLLPNHKADILHGLLIIFSCMILVRFDASKMYHSIRGQAAIKLYVIYNVLEVGDRLFSALGQDVLECLFSKETLERKPDGRSKVFRPIWMFALALIYNVIHAAALFYQVITLNVAVNSYSNALLTLLMSNQFVEIKGTVFKKFEKENLFQLTCADVVERFQLWLMLLIIALRNIVEVGGLSIGLGASSSPPGSATSAFNPNTTGTPMQSVGILPQAFTLFPKWTGQVLGPFLIVLGSEMLVDWLKHAYINKFNSVKPDIYGRFLDVLAKDYYSHAFADQNLTKRLGLPVLPLACLFIRASVQTYHMLLATHMPQPLPSPATSLITEATSSPATTAALAHIDHIFRRALNRSSFGAGGDAPTTTGMLTSWSLDDMIALATMLVFFLALYLVLLGLKLVLGMCLLNFARARYAGMKERERASYDANGRRVGGWGVVEVDEEKRRWIYDDDAEGLRGLREREARAKEKAKGGDVLKLDGVGRYMMAAKRIW